MSLINIIIFRVIHQPVGTESATTIHTLDTLHFIGQNNQNATHTTSVTDCNCERRNLYQDKATAFPTIYLIYIFPGSSYIYILPCN
jgi:hypothetical protein